ncbi:MAG: pirin family protein [Gammaproteobacteria bacterium]
MTNRSVLSIRITPREYIGDLETRNALSNPTDRAYDPFLILGHHGPQVFGPDNRGMPFEDHPHRGFETVTFVLEGDLVHTDSSGHRRTVTKGGVQWMTAGAGVVHNEQVPPAFFRTGGLLEIIQLWVNLPARLKTTPAAYIGVQAEGIPSVPLEGGGKLHLVSGEYASVAGPIRSLTGVFMSWADLVAGRQAALPAPHGRTVLLYVVHGEVTVSGQAAKGGDLIRVGNDGDMVDLKATCDATVLFAHADPIGEPVVARGPFVMNSEAEISEAFHDYHAGLYENPPSIEEIA